MKTIFIILTVVATFVDVIKCLTKEVVSECDSDFECLPFKDCPYYHNQQNLLKSTSDKSVKAKIIQELRERICNRKEKLFCCPKTFPSEKSQLPILCLDSECEGCGIPQDVASFVREKLPLIIFLINFSFRLLVVN